MGVIAHRPVVRQGGASARPLAMPRDAWARAASPCGPRRAAFRQRTAVPCRFNRILWNTLPGCDVVCVVTFTELTEFSTWAKTSSASQQCLAFSPSQLARPRIWVARVLVPVVATLWTAHLAATARSVPRLALLPVPFAMTSRRNTATDTRLIAGHSARPDRHCKPSGPLAPVAFFVPCGQRAAAAKRH